MPICCLQHCRKASTVDTADCGLLSQSLPALLTVANLARHVLSYIATCSVVSEPHVVNNVIFFADPSIAARCMQIITKTLPYITDAYGDTQATAMAASAVPNQLGIATADMMGVIR